MTVSAFVVAIYRIVMRCKSVGDYENDRFSRRASGKPGMSSHTKKWPDCVAHAR